MAKIFAYGTAMVAFLLIQAGGGFAQQSGSGAEVTAPPLKIDSGDLVDVSIYDNPDLAGHFRVDEKGDIVFPLLGPVHVAGETAEEAGQTISKQYVAADILKAENAHVSVFIAEFATQRIFCQWGSTISGALSGFGHTHAQRRDDRRGRSDPQASSKIVITRKADPDNPIKVNYDPTAATPVVRAPVQIFSGGHNFSSQCRRGLCARHRQPSRALSSQWRGAF